MLSEFMNSLSLDPHTQYTPNLSVADMLSRYFPNTELQSNQLEHKQHPLQIEFALLQNNTLKPVHYLIKHEEVLPHQKHDSHPVLDDYGTDPFSIRINDKGSKDFFKPRTHSHLYPQLRFKQQFKTPIKRNNKSIHQQSLFLNDTDITSDDEEHMYSRILKHNSIFTTDTTIQVHKRKPSLPLKNQSPLHHKNLLLQ